VVFLKDMGYYLRHLTGPAGNVGNGRHYEYPKPIIDDESSDLIRKAAIGSIGCSWNTG
jgi:hypothetical protein